MCAKHGGTGMDFNLERGIRQKQSSEIEHQSLYARALIELDDRGAQVGQDMIPWGWTSNFVGTEFVVIDRLSYEISRGMNGDEPEQMSSSRKTMIQARLRPGNHREEDSIFDREPTYRFFGTDRVITDWQLHITPTSNKAEEGCSTWGSVSYDSEVDFRTSSSTDIVTFYLNVNQSLYDRYLWNIGQGLANRLALAVGLVDGFYSEWSPGISASEIKVLAGSEHKIEDGDGTEWPRLGKVGKCDFFMNSHFDLLRPVAPAVDHDDDDAEASEDRRGFRWPGKRA